MTAFSLSALMTVIRRHKLKPIEQITYEMVAEAIAIDEAHRNRI